MKKINWYIQRLKKMPPQEIPYRLQQAVLKKYDKFFPPYSFSSLKPTSISFNIKPISKSCSDKISQDLSDLFEGEQFVKEAEKILQHKFNIFGFEADFGDPINFHLDPKTGKSWPKKFWGDIDYRDGKNIGGIKFAWELNRLQHWPRLAIAYCLTGNRKYYKELFSELDYWLKANPYPKGINWISGIELGLRIVSLFYTLKVIGIKGLGFKEKRNIINFVYLHARHLYRYPSKYSSCANHALAEALGLFIAGIAFPDFKDASKWKTFGKKILEREVVRQVLPDGSSFEHTIPYLQFVTDHFLIFYLLCREYDENISPMIEKRLKAICNFMMHIMDKRGNIPMIGDDDDGYLLKLSLEDNNNFLSILNTCGILFKRSDWIHPAARLDTKTLLLLGRQAIQQWEDLYAIQAWKRKSAYFNNAGLGIITGHKSGKEILLIVNSGPTGLEPLGGHGHADALSFWLSVNGQPFFVDPGTYLYHSGGKWRRYFRSTAAHNTVEIDSQDQAEQVADFMFASFYKIHNVYWSDKEEVTTWSASHDGYRRLPDPVMHYRKILFDKTKSLFKIIDSVIAQNSHQIKLFFHLHPDTHVQEEGNNSYLISYDITSVRLLVDNNMKAEIYHGSKEPLLGWYSPKFNCLQETKTLVFSKEAYGSERVESKVTVL